MKILPILVAGFAYFVLGGLWFTPLFGKYWDKAVGFSRPPKWRPSAGYYLGPLIGCVAATAAVALLIHWTHSTTLEKNLLVGVTVGLGFGVTVTSVNAISPNMPRPGLYALVVGSYHATGLSLVAALLYWL
jgi:ABC-type Mn2+/Zn2+ transport system permease subunit